jgi:hypothetical protein
MARFRCHWKLQSDGRTRSRRVDLPWNRRSKPGRLPLATVDGPLQEAGLRHLHYRSSADLHAFTRQRR